MSHLKKQEIFNEYAKEKGFKDWEALQFQYCTLLMTDDEFQYFMFEACDLVQAELLNRIANKALIDVKVPGIEQWRGTFYSSPDVQIIVNKDSITNPENLIK